MQVNAIENVPREQDCRAGWRLALAIAVGMTFSVTSGSMLPFLGPLFAAQFLLSGGGPVPLPKAIVMTGMVFLVGQALVLLCGIFDQRPVQLLAILGLFYFCLFYIQALGKGGPAVFLCLVIGIMVPLLNRAHDQLDSGILASLVIGVATGCVLTWFAFAILPETRTTQDALEPPAYSLQKPGRRAAVYSFILLAVMTTCLTKSSLGLAFVIPITVASILSQLHLASSGRTAVALMAVNLLGGVLASLLFTLVELRPSISIVFLASLLAGFLLGGNAVTKTPTAKLYGGALVSFLILFGSGISPLPTQTPESFATRIGHVALAISFTLGAAAMLLPVKIRYSRIGL